MSQEQAPETKEETQEEEPVIKDAGGAQEPAETAPEPETGEQLEVQDASALTSVWNGLRLHPKTWEPTDSPKALLYICHGVGEYMGRYEKLGEVLANSGILAYGHDHVGHGLSEGDRAHVESVDTYVEDVIRHVEQMKTQHPNTPSLLMGHSMGGCVAIRVAQRRPDLFTAMVLSSAAAEISTGPLIQFFARVLSHLVPQIGVQAIDPNYISSIPEEVTMYVEDPLIYHGSLKAKWAAAVLDAIKLARQHIGEIRLPLLVIHGTDDHLVPITSSEFVFGNVSSGDKTFERFEGHRHEVLHDRDQEKARQLIKDWILDHLSPPPQPQEPQEQREQQEGQEGGQEQEEQPEQ